MPIQNTSIYYCATPKEVTITGYASQKVAVDIANEHIKKTVLSREIYWLEKLKDKARKKNIVCRTVLVSGGTYGAYIRSLVESQGLELDQGQMEFLDTWPKYVWVTEITLPNLYVGNKTKLGDVVVDACASTAAITERECVVFTWFPGFMRRGIQPPSEYWDLTTHVPLIRCGSRHPLIEW